MRSGLQVVVLMGGVSGEREISLESGKAVAGGLRSAGLQVAEVVVTDRRLSAMSDVRCDIAFIALHGRFGEDGGVQAILESQDIPYTGSGVAASMRAMDKALSKGIFQARGIPTPAYEVINGSPDSPSPKELGEKLLFPLVVKPAREGSSLGVNLAHDVEELVGAIEVAHEFGRVSIVEKYAKGRELTVGILEERTLPIIELKPKRPFFDFAAKYEDGLTEYVVEPDLPGGVCAEVEETAMKAFRALGCTGFGRVDMILSESNEPLVLEVNTIPGFTRHSLVPMAAKAAGIGFPGLCCRIVELALEEAGRI